MARPNTKPVNGTAPDADKATVAPWPLVDRNPVVLGSNLSMSSVSAAARMATTGYRQQFVDILDELIERDPHAHAVVQQIILSVAGGRLELAPAKTEPGTPDEELACEIAGCCRKRIEAIPSLTESLAALLWGIYYGVTAQETSWAIDGEGWYPARLHFVHSRRLGFPDPTSWDLHVWDQGFVRWWDAPMASPTSKLYGIKVADFPGKFVVHSPQLRGDYPTRDGLGRVLVYWMVLKGIAARGAGQYLERFAKPWVTGTYTTGEAKDSHRAANADDIAAANAAASALGIGSVASAVLPDSVHIDISHPTGGITQAEFIAICDAQMSKAVVGQTLTTEVGHNGGNRALGQVQKEGSKELARYHAGCLAETLKRDLVSWIVRLNYPDALHLIPQVTIHVDEKPDPMQAVSVAAAAVAIGMPVDADDLAERLGLKLVDPTNPDARRLSVVSPVDPFSLEPGARKEAAAQAAIDDAGADPSVDDEADEAEAEPADEPENDVAATMRQIVTTAIGGKLAEIDFRLRELAASPAPSPLRLVPAPVKPEPTSMEKAEHAARMTQALIADLRESRQLGLTYSQKQIDETAARYGVPAPKMESK